MTQIDHRIQKKLFERIRLQNREPIGDVLDPTTGDTPTYLHDVFARTSWARVISAVPSIVTRIGEEVHKQKLFRLSSAYEYYKRGYMDILDPSLDNTTYTNKNEPLASMGGFTTEGGTFRPHSGITGITTEFQNHSIQNITINWKFYDRSRFDDYQNALLKHGRSILVEFGWGDPNEQQAEEQVNDPETMLEYFESITEKILNRGGDYYAACGIISGFTWNVVEGGAYECTTTVTSMGTTLFKSEINKNLDAQYPEVDSQISAKSLESAYRKANFTFGSFMVQLNEAIGVFNGEGDLLKKIKEGSADEILVEQKIEEEWTKRGMTKEEYEKLSTISGTPENGLGKAPATVVKETPDDVKLIRNDIIKEIRNIRRHFKAKFMLLTAAVVDNKGIEGKDGTDFLKFMLANYQGASWSGGTDIFPHDAGKQQSKELEHGMKIYLYTTDGVRDY